jgi:hypothetical protein
MNRADVVSLLLLALCVGVFFGPSLAGDSAVFTWNMDLWHPWAASASPEDLERPTRLADCARQFAVMRGLAGEALRDGRIPLWNRRIYSGTPFLANFQPAVFYPPNLALAFSGLSLPNEMTAYLSLHLLVGISGVFVLLRTWGVSAAAAFAGALVFGWSGYNASRTGIPTMVATGVWLPWALAATRRWFDRGGSGAWAGMAGSLAMAGLAGFAQIFVFTVYAWGLFGLIDGVSSRRRRRPAAWAGWAGAAVVALLITSVHLVPTLEFMELAQDAENSPEMLASGTLHPWTLGKLLAPELLGHPVDGTNASHLLSVGNGYYFQTERSTAVYVGLLPLLLAAIVLLAPGDHRREAGGALAVALLGFLFCFWNPLTALATHLPGLSFSRPDRATFLWCTGMALLAGLGADRLASAEGTGLRRASNVLAVTVGTIAVLFAAAISVIAPRFLPADIIAFLGRETIRHAALAGLGTAAAATGLVFLRARGTLGRTAFLAAAIVLIGADLGWFASRLNLMQPRESIFRPPAAGGSLEYLQGRQFAEAPFRILTFEPRRHPFGGILPPSASALYGLDDVLGFDSINLARYRELMDVIDPGIVIKRGNFRGVQRPEALSRPLVNLLNVRYVLAGPSERGLPGVERVHRSDLDIYRNPQALPRAFLVGKVRVQPQPEIILRSLALPDFRPDLWAWSERSIDQELERPGAADPGSPGSAKYHEGDERVVVEVWPERTALLVVTDSWYPGWKALVDGAERPIHRVNHAFRGVVVRPGDRRVVFEYHPASFRYGAMLSLAGLGLLGLGALLARSRTESS